VWICGIVIGVGLVCARVQSAGFFSINITGSGSATLGSVYFCATSVSQQLDKRLQLEYCQLPAKGQRRLQWLPDSEGLELCNSVPEQQQRAAAYLQQGLGLPSNCHQRVQEQPS
jgi:hypothetical protein